VALNSGEDRNVAKFPDIEVSRVLCTIDRVPQDRKIPLKKRKILEVLTPRSVDFLDTGLLEHIFGDLEGTDEVVLSMLRVKWTLFALKFVFFKNIVDGTRDDVRTMSTVSTEEFEKLDPQLTNFEKISGKQNAEMEGTTVFVL